ncbi:hypothetical protein [Altericista sp. CCNU0014]|uniref:hypothetical protein n=1 Tax=Altericista sp. CCNU0014 TaxID=3082949 RepID=UPI00384E663E
MCSAASFLSRFTITFTRHRLHSVPAVQPGQTGKEAIAHISGCAVAHGFPCFRYSSLRSSAGGAPFRTNGSAA